MSHIDVAITEITALYAARFRERLRPMRMIGQEAEFPVVWPDGRAGDVHRVLRSLLAEDDFEPMYDDVTTQSLLIGVEQAHTVYSIEVGQGTVELSIGPYDDLCELQVAFDSAWARLKQVVERNGMYLLGFGIQPRTRPALKLMTPRRHYQALYTVIGAPWLYLTTTAANQVHIDICRAELLDVINWMNLLSGPIIALCGNSSIYGGRIGRYVAGREGLLRGLGEYRYGMPPQYYPSLEEYIDYICRYECYVLKQGNNYRRFKRPFTQYLARYGADMDAYLWHEHYTWSSARARAERSTIEIRPACQQPAGNEMVVGALSLGWVEALSQVRAFIESQLGADAWPAMIAYRRAAVHEGLAAREPAPNFLSGLIAIAEEGLRQRGRGEEKFLKPIWNRLDRKRSPGQEAQAMFKRYGMEKFLEAVRV